MAKSLIRMDSNNNLSASGMRYSRLSIQYVVTSPVYSIYTAVGAFNKGTSSLFMDEACAMYKT